MCQCFDDTCSSDLFSLVSLTCLPESQGSEKTSKLYYYKKVKIAQKKKGQMVLNQTTHFAKVHCTFFTTFVQLHEHEAEMPKTPHHCLKSPCRKMLQVRRAIFLIFQRAVRRTPATPPWTFLCAFQGMSWRHRPYFHKYLRSCVLFFFKRALQVFVELCFTSAFRLASRASSCAHQSSRCPPW